MNLVVVITLATATIGALASFVSALVHYLNRRDTRQRAHHAARAPNERAVERDSGPKAA